jgi:hypothetical protein
MESNRIAAYLHKQCHSTFPFSGYQHATPPTAFANILNPLADPIQQLPSNLINPAPYGLSQPAPLNQYSLPAQSNPYQRPSPVGSLVNNTWFCRYPCSQNIIYDNGIEFKLHFEALCDSYGL